MSSQIMRAGTQAINEGNKKAKKVGDLSLKMQREKSKLSKSNIKIAVKKTISSFDAHDSPAGLVDVHEFSRMGNGCLIIAVWSGRGVI